MESNVKTNAFWLMLRVLGGFAILDRTYSAFLAAKVVALRCALSSVVAPRHQVVC